MVGGVPIRPGNRFARCPGTTPVSFTLARVPYEVQTPVFEGPVRPAAPPDPARAGRPLRVSLSAIVDAYLAELEQLRGPRPRGRHRVPAHRRHAGRAEGPPPAARATTTSTSTTSWRSGRSATCCSPACSSARRSRTPPAPCRCWPPTPGRSFPRTAGLEERFLALAPDLLAGVTPSDLRDARSSGPPRPSRCPGSTSTTWPRSGSASPTPSRSCSTSCPAPAASPSGGSPTSLVERLEVVVRFLAVLELFKQGLVDLDQPGSVRRHRRSPGSAATATTADGGLDAALSPAIDAYDG